MTIGAGLSLGSNVGQAEVVRFWRTMEMFSPPGVDKVDREKLVFAMRPGEPLPWEPEHELASRKLRETQSWQHVVYLGIYRLENIFDILSHTFAHDRESFDERPLGESALAAFEVGEDGRALIGSAVLSSCAWATEQVRRNRNSKQDWLAGFTKAAEAFSEVWQDLVTVNQNDALTPRALNKSDLDQCLAVAAAIAAAGLKLPCTDIRISSRVVAKRTADKPSGHDFLNSFIMGDLDVVAEQVAANNYGKALEAYLRPEAQIATSRRVDVRDDMDTVLAATAPHTVPEGRWPSNTDHPLALNQQLAVNTAVRMPDAGILGVNGPPGTGKTTMLRDLVAALVVERARRLSGLSEPSKAFTGNLRWKTGKHTRIVNVWRGDLTGFEMVVASANNGAVQNVTDEIPAASAIDNSWRKRAVAIDYFPEIATALLAPDPNTNAKPPKDIQAWALVAARLGNKTNRSRFVNTFWYHSPGKSDNEPWFGLRHVLKSYEQQPPDRPWSAAVDDFRVAERREATVRAARAEVYQAVERRARIDDEVTALRRSVLDAEAAIERASERRTAAINAERARHAEAVTEAEARRAEHERLAQVQRAALANSVRHWEQMLAWQEGGYNWHQTHRPTLKDILLTCGAEARLWAEENVKWSARVNDARQRLAAARGVRDTSIPPPPLSTPEALVTTRQKVTLAKHEFDEALRRKAEHERTLIAREAEKAALDEQLACATSTLGKYYPDASWWNDRERRELAALWTDQEWNLARSELLLAAMDLHKAFLAHAAKQMHSNLQAAMDLVSGEVPRDLPVGAALAAWQTLFFVVPVVSTTFASYARLFGHLGRESLGWLLIDEAGQATPQNAVGALWRTKRAVVVGDPLQLEPITTLPFRAEQAIRNELGIDEQWSPSRTSVQRLADRLTSLGTSLPDEDGKTWVGVPLTVHRRCDQPMFDIVNAVAYDDLMINGTGMIAGEQFAEANPDLLPSQWIDVVSDRAHGHWIPMEGVELDRVLSDLADLDFDMSQVMVIAPFRDIASQIRERKERCPGLVAGTVHTAQGKQADVVVLVLGGNPAKPAARRWAASKPNLLNVAVSRAKRRLYVIGDRRAWSAEPYFDTLAEKLVDPHLDG